MPRRGIRTKQVHIEYNPRPERFHIRVMEPMINITYTTDQNNRLVTRRVHHMVGFRLEDGSYVNVYYNSHLEVLDNPFAIRQDVIIPSGTYTFGEWVFQYNTDPSRWLYTKLRYSPQTFFDGFRKDTDVTLGIRATSRLSAELRFRRNDGKLPWGDFKVNLGTLRLDYSLSPQMTLRTLLQYNSELRELNSSIRFHFIYRSGSDLYLVYNDLRRDPLGLEEVRDRQLALKWNYMFSR